MNVSALEFADLIDLLRRPVTDEKVGGLLGSRLATLKRVGEFGYVNFREHGLEIAFSEAPRVIPANAITDPTFLRVCAFHLHREGHEGFAAYRGKLPNGVALDEPEWSILRKMGEPTWSGGGGVDSTGSTIPYWIRYCLGDDYLRFQSDRSGHVEMITMMAPDVRLPRPDPSRRLDITSIPSRVSILWHRERIKDSPLTKEEVTKICNESAAVALSLMTAAAVEESRGYRDIDGDRLWEDWQEIRIDLIRSNKDQSH